MVRETVPFCLHFELIVYKGTFFRLFCHCIATVTRMCEFKRGYTVSKFLPSNEDIILTSSLYFSKEMKEDFCSFKLFLEKCKPFFRKILNIFELFFFLHFSVFLCYV